VGSGERVGTGKGPGPVHLLAGGPGARGGVYRPIIRDLLRQPGKPAPLVAYVGAATDDDRRFSGFMEELVTAAGPCTFRLAPVVGRRAAGGAAREVIAAADLVLMGGGDVDLGMRRIMEADLARLLKEKHAGGAPFLGVSAGAILLGLCWIRWPDPDDDASAELFDCLGLVPIHCDCHGEEDGWAELKTLLRLAGGRALGHGIRAGAGLRVAAGGTVEPICGEVDRFQVRGGKVIPL
jgi:hypothetical protein